MSYLARWIVPAPLLARAVLALNFHPGPPEYPGYGCNNFAIYEGAREYGVTCHHMAPRVDTGAIVEVLRFPVLDSDNAGTLLARAVRLPARLVLRRAGTDNPRRSASRLAAKRGRDSLSPGNNSASSGRLTSAMTEEEIARRKRALDVGALKPAP